MIYAHLAEFALTLPGVTENVRKTEIDLFRDGRHMARLRHKGMAIAFRLTWDDWEAWLGQDPEVFFVTPHYEGYPYVLAWIEKLADSDGKALIRAAWEAAPMEIPLRGNPKV